MMLLSELQSLVSEIAFPCTFDELMDQCERNGVRKSIINELRDRFEEEYGDNSDEIDESDFDESDNYYDPDYYPED